MASRWGNNGNRERLYFLGLQITADSDSSHEIKRHLLLGRKAMTNLDNILKSRDITNKGPSYGFSSSRVWIWELDYKESWAVKIDPFELWCWRRLLRITWTASRSNQSIQKESSLEYSLEGLMLKLKLLNTLATWCEELTHWKRPWCWGRLKTRGEGDNGGRDG